MDKTEKKKAAREYRERRRKGGVYAICCKENGKRLLQSTEDMQGSRNRFDFSQSTGGCVHPKLRADWDRLGGKAFEFVPVETLEQKETQSDSDFYNETQALCELLISQEKPEALY
jgi:hypothetical protein